MLQLACSRDDARGVTGSSNFAARPLSGAAWLACAMLLLPEVRRKRRQESAALRPRNRRCPALVANHRRCLYIAHSRFSDCQVADSIPRFEEVSCHLYRCKHNFLHGSSWTTILPRTYRAKRDAAPFDDDRALRRVLTVRGRAGAMLGMCAMASEKAEDACMALSEMLPADRLGKVQLLSSDCASTKLSAELKCMMPNLQCLVLDPIHVLIVYEQLDSTWSYKTQVLDVTVKLASLGSP